MTIYISMCVFLITFMCGMLECMHLQIVGVICVLSLILMVVCALSKPKYKEKELFSWCELLPIMDGIYAIKTDKNKFLCKYIDNEDENKVKMDVINVKTDILTMTEGGKPTLFIFETKAKNAWLLPGDYTTYNVVLSIPEGSVLEE